MITCRMIAWSNSPHLSQVFTGFTLLHRAGKIALSQECRKQDYFDRTKPQHLRDAGHAHLLVIVNDNIKLYYDTHDSHEIDEAAAREVSFYFKRSYADHEIPEPFKAKVYPLGFNYLLYPSGLDDLEAQRSLALGDSSPWGYSQGRALPSFRPTPENMQSAPEDVVPPKILFMTRAWEPFDHPERTKEKISERISINETRARCMELLREEFGSSFFGGFLPTDYAAANYGTVLLPDREIADKENYLRLLGAHSICVATTGLHGSIGWKMGEYVAFSKAIVSERLIHRVPGDFEPGRNYLEFDSPERCAETVRELFSNAASRRRMMKRNHEYYRSYLRPEALIERTLDIGLAQARGRPARTAGD